MSDEQPTYSFFKVPSVFKGEVALLTFSSEGKKIGELWGTGGKLSFTGDAEASAKIFFDEVIRLHQDSISGANEKGDV